VPQIGCRCGYRSLRRGGIADVQGIAAAFALGANGVQLGTAFLGCPEAAVPAPCRSRLNVMSDDATEATHAFTGRPARAIRNRLFVEMAGAEALKFPLQASIVRPLWRVPEEHARAQLMPFWAGQAAVLVRELPAGIGAIDVVPWPSGRHGL